LRLWEVEGHPAEATIDAHALGVTHAWRCELLEKIQGPLPVERGVVRVTVPARGMAAVRFDT